MDRPRAALGLVTSLILCVALLTGPALGFFPVPEKEGLDAATLGTGNASISVLDLPDRASIRKGGGVYTLRVSDATLSVTNVTGQPILVYRIDIEGMGYSRGSLTVLESGFSNQVSVQLSRSTLDASDVRETSYPATLRVLLRGDGPDRTIAEKNVTVRVQR